MYTIRPCLNDERYDVVFHGIEPVFIGSFKECLNEVERLETLSPVA